MTRSVLLLVTAIWWAHSAHAFQVDFSRNTPADFLELKPRDKVQVTEKEILLPKQVASHPIPVEPGKKYKLVIKARVESDLVVEKNHRALQLTRKNPRILSGYTVAFHDANGAAVQLVPMGGGMAAHNGISGKFLTENEHPYVNVFHVPQGASSLTISFRTAGVPTWVSGVELSEETREGTVNVNPDFRYGELNYCGWSTGRSGKLHVLPDGKGVLASGWGGGARVFPVDPNRQYRVTAVGEAAEGAINIRYLDQAGQTIGNMFLIRPTRQGATREFVPLPGSAAALLSITKPLFLEQLRVEEIK